MGWLTPGSLERKRVHYALAKGEISWDQRPLESALAMDGFSPKLLAEMAADEVANDRRLVHFIDDPRRDWNDVPPLEDRWYAVELQCDDQLMFFKFKLVRDQPTRARVVSFHQQKERPWNH